MAKVGVIGDLDSIIGFRALGMEVVPVRTGHEAREALNRMIDDDAGVIFLTEPFADDVSDIMDVVSERKLPAIILIPSASEPSSIGLDRLRQSVRRATGMDILKQKLENRPETADE